MGQPQFMPDSYLRFAVDFDGDGRRDIWDSRADALGSIANYLARSGWRAGEPWGEPVLAPAGFDPIETGPDNRRTLGEWMRLGVRRMDGSAFSRPEIEGALILPEGGGGDAFIVYRNFAAIRRYNSPIFYALSVGLLGDRSASSWPIPARSATQWTVGEIRQRVERGQPLVAVVDARLLPGHPPSEGEESGDQPLLIVRATPHGLIYSDPTFSSSLGYGLEVSDAAFDQAWQAASTPKQALAFWLAPTRHCATTMTSSASRRPRPSPRCPRHGPSASPRHHGPSAPLPPPARRSPLPPASSAAPEPTQASEATRTIAAPRATTATADRPAPEVIALHQFSGNR